MKRRGLDSIESWIVAGAGSIVFLLATCPMRLGGQLFVSLLDHFETSRREASFPFAIAYLMRSVSGPFAGYVGEKFGLRAVTIAGSFFCAIGVGGCFFAQNIIAVDVFLGLVYGIGFGWSTAVIPEIINLYFDKHRAKAQGIIFGGSGVGAFIIPPLLEVILFEIGMSGTFLIISGLVLHSVPAAMLLTKRKPESAYNRKLPAVESDTSTKQKPGSKFHLVESDTLSKQKSKSAVESNSLKTLSSYEAKTRNQNTFSHMNINGSAPKKSVPMNTYSKSDIKLLSFKSILEEKHLKNEANGLNIIASNVSGNTVTCSEVVNGNPKLPNLLRGSQDDVRKQNGNTALLNSKTVAKESEKNREGQQSSCCQKTSSKSFYNIIKVLWQPKFLIVSFIQSAHFYVMYICWTIIVDVIRDKGIEQTHEVYFVMAVSFFDTIGRFFLTSVTDCGHITNSNFSATCFAGMGLSCLLLTLVSGFYPTMAAVCLLGLMYGGNTSGLPGIVTDFFSAETRSMAMASRLTLYAPMSFTMSPLIGYFRGNLGSYNGLLYVMTSVCIFCTATLVLLPKLVRHKINHCGN